VTVKSSARHPMGKRDPPEPTPSLPLSSSGGPPSSTQRTKSKRWERDFRDSRCEACSNKSTTWSLRATCSSIDKEKEKEGIEETRKELKNGQYK